MVFAHPPIRDNSGFSRPFSFEKTLDFRACLDSYFFVLFGRAPIRKNSDFSNLPDSQFFGVFTLSSPVLHQKKTQRSGWVSWCVLLVFTDLLRLTQAACAPALILETLLVRRWLSAAITHSSASRFCLRAGGGGRWK